MPFTRFYDDPFRIEKRLELSTFEGRYQLDRPGPGVQMPFMEEPQMRLQKWGANLQSNTVNLESDLRGMTRKLNRDDIPSNEYRNHATDSHPLQFYASQNPFVEESRASHPAWTYRAVPVDRWEQPMLNPQSNLEKPFLNNVQTRILRRN
jgi:hypothetical protein